MSPTDCHLEKEQDPRQLHPPQPDLWERTVTSAKYHAEELTENLFWRKPIQSAAAKANEVCAFIYWNLSGCPAAVQTRCDKHLLQPVPEYAPVVWDPHQ